MTDKKPEPPNFNQIIQDGLKEIYDLENITAVAIAGALYTQQAGFSLRGRFIGESTTRELLVCELLACVIVEIMNGGYTQEEAFTILKADTLKVIRRMRGQNRRGPDIRFSATTS